MKDPAMLFYTSDFLTGVTLLSMKERGQYITLLCLQQQLGHMSLKDMRKAVGTLSPSLMDKFLVDEEGLYFNRRADIEIEKRSAHCQKQRDNISKRWSPSDNLSSNPVVPEAYHGITTVIPLENENETGTGSKRELKEIRGSTERECEGKPEGDPDIAQVFKAYFDTINPSPTPMCIDTLKGYAMSLGAELVCHAIEIAVDENKRTWSYVRAILERYSAAGYKSLEDVKRAEAARLAAKGRKSSESISQPQDMGEVYKRLCNLEI